MSRTVIIIMNLKSKLHNKCSEHKVLVIYVIYGIIPETPNYLFINQQKLIEQLLCARHCVEKSKCRLRSPSNEHSCSVY